MRMKTRNRSADLPFPRDIMIEILHRLPLKTLLTCKRVSKQWKDLIEDPIFYKRHTNSRTAIILGRNDTLSALFVSHDEDLIDGPNPPLEMHPVPIDMATYYSSGTRLLNSGSPNETIACVRSANGIFFFHNLFTGASFVVEDAPMRRYSYSWICYGFGYDSHADDHKIFVACNYHVEERYGAIPFDFSRVQNPENSLFWVYSFNNKGWEQFEGFPDCAAYDLVRHQSIGHSFNGIHHWVFGRRGATQNVHREEAIVTYDLHTSRFGEMLVPKNAYGDAVKIHGRSGKVSQLNGLLCYAYTMMDCGFGGDYRHVVWVMNEYGVEDSWQKLVSIDCSLVSEIPTRLRGHPYVWDSVAPAALHESEEGRIAVLFVCHYSGKMFWYGLKEGEIRVIDEDHLLKERRLHLKRKRDFC